MSGEEGAPEDSEGPERGPDPAEDPRPAGTAARFARDRRVWAAAAAVVVGLVLVAVLTSGGGGVAGLGGPAVYDEPALADPVPYDGRSPALPAGETERVLVELPRPALGGRPDPQSLTAAQQQAYVASLRDEAASLISALEARDVRLKDVVTFELTFHGFAATIDSQDFTRLQSIGVRVRANRRFFPAYSQPVPAESTVQPEGRAPQLRVALLAGGVEGAQGYDAVDADDDPAPGEDPRDPDREEVGGAPLHAALEALGARPRVVRVSTLDEGEEYARTDTLLAGLERTVDPNGDGDTSDHDPVALVGVSAPYAGFADAPEAVATRNAGRLGTVVVAPSGHEGEGAGTVGSPGAAAIAVGPLRPDSAVARTRLSFGEELTVEAAAVLAGRPPEQTLRVVEPVAANTTDALLVADSPSLQGSLAVVEPGSNPGARVAAAAGAGAAAVLLAEPRAGRPLPAVPAGRVDVPVMGVTGEAAIAVLEDLPPDTSVRLRGVSLSLPGEADGSPSRFTSQGAAYDGTPKPELVRPGTIVAGGSLIVGSAIAAARVAVEAARLDAADSDAARAQLLPPPDAGVPPPPGAPQVAIGAVTVEETDRATSVQFTVGTFTRGDPAAEEPTTVIPAQSLELTLTRADDEEPLERLTPPGGQRGLLPGAYAYALPRSLLRDLAKGSYVFRVAARAPRQDEPTLAASPPFEVE